MTTKEFLNQPFELQRLIKIKEKRIQCYRELASCPTSPSFEPHYAATRNTKAPFERYLEKINVLEEELINDYAKLEYLKHEVDVAIDGMEDPIEELVLRYRYSKLMKIGDIAREMNYSHRWIKRVHARALEHFERSHPSSPSDHC